MTSAQRVRKAALTLFAARGFHGTGIRDVAREAGLSTASLYHYMGTKEDLLAGLMLESLRRLADGAGAALEDATDPAERVGRLVALHVMTHALRPDETRVVDNEVASLSPAARRSVVRQRDSYERLWAETIEHGVRAGAFDTAEPGLTRLALLEMCSGVARWYTPRGKVTIEALAAHYATLALRMLGSSGGKPDLARCREIMADVWAPGS